MAKNPVLILALVILLAGIWISYLSNNGALPLVAASAAPNSDFSNLPGGDDVNLGSAGTVQGIHTSQDPTSQSNQQNNLNGNSSGSSPLSVYPSSPPSSQPITIEPDPLPITPISPCKYLLESPQSPCQPICDPCGGNKMIMCPMMESSSQFRYPCSPCGYPTGSNIACAVDGTPVGQL